jgi:hypothetical protein
MPVCGPRKPAPGWPGQRAPPPAKRARPQYARAKAYDVALPCLVRDGARAPRGHDRSYPPVGTVSLRRAAKVPHRDLVRTAGRHRDGAIRRPEPPACSPERPGRQPPTRRPCITRRSARRGRITSRSTSPSPWPDAPDPSPSGWPAAEPTGCRHGTAPRTSNGPGCRAGCSPSTWPRMPGLRRRAGLRVWLTLRRSEDELVAQVRRRWARSGSIGRSPPGRAHPAGSASLRSQPAGTGTDRH